MTAAPPVDLLRPYLSQLIEAPDNWARVAIFNAASDQGLASRYVVCDRCPWADRPRVMTLPGAVRHLRESESSWLEAHPDGSSRLHQLGDLRPASDLERRGPGVPPLWGVETCRRRGCSGRVVWARTTSGKAIAIDADPDPAGTVVLVAAERFTAAPYARFLHTEFERDQVPLADRHTKHVNTCTNPPEAPR